MDTKPLPVGTQLKQRYRVTRLIAGGGMAWIYQVEEQRPDGSGRVWAMKELRADVKDAPSLAEAGALFEQEANLLVRLSHPNLPQVAAFFTEGGRSYLIMEFIHGQSLQKRLDAAGSPLLESEVVPYAIQICDVLSYLHTQPMPIIFRDLKPSNIMVTPEGQIKLIDFGIARTFKQGQNRDTVSMGSENYAAPEQWGQAQSDGRADIYGLGATLYHLLGGSPPLPAFVPGARTPLAELNGAVSAQLVAIIDRAMAADRQQRYRTAAHMRQDLVQCLAPWERLRLRTASRGAPVTAVPGGRQPKQLSTISPGNGPDSPNTAIYCARCGASNRAQARFCRNCGAPLSATAQAMLTVLEPTGADADIPLLGSSLLIGRPRGRRPVDLDVSRHDPRGYVSRNHALVERIADEHRITDLDSSNGTYINGTKLRPHSPWTLQNGDRIQMGKVVFVYRTREMA